MSSLRGDFITPLYRTLTVTLLELDLWYAESVQRHLINSPYTEIGNSLSAPLSDYREAISDYKSGQPMKKASKALILKSLEQDREYLKMFSERLRKEGVVNPFIMVPASFIAETVVKDIGHGIEEIKQLPERN